MRRSSLLLLTALVLSVAPLHGQHSKVFEPVDLANLKQVTEPEISPDGKQIVYVVTTPVAAGKHKDAHLWIVSTDAPGQARPFVYSSAADTSPQWSPDGNFVAFLSDRTNPIGSGAAVPFHFSILNAKARGDLSSFNDPKEKKPAAATMQLWEIPLHGGEAIPLTNIPGGIKSFRWSKDGKWIAFVRTDQDTKEEHDRKEKKDDQVVVDQDYKYDRLWLYDVAHHEARLLTTADINIDDFDWSPDGTQLVARVSPTPRINDYWRISKVVLLNRQTGAVVKTLEQHAGYMAVRWSPDGTKIAFSKMTPLGITDLHVIYSLASGKEITVEHAFPGTVSRMTWAPDSRKLYLQGILQAHTVVDQTDAASGISTPLPAITTSNEYGRLTVSRDGNTVAFVGRTTTHPDEVWEFAHGQSKVLTETNPQVKDMALGTEKQIQWKSSKDGRTIYGVLLLPPGYQPGKAYKTVVHIHGGPEEAWTVGWHGSWYDYGAMLASHGYVVLLPNPRGSDGQGPAFTEANYQGWGDGDFQDIMDGMDLLVAQGISDPKKLVVGGWSYGGFMTAWTATHTNRFRAAMVGAGVTDLFSMATTTDISPSFEQGYFGDLATNSKLYDEHSPVRYLTQCHTPVLVLHGEADPRVPISQGEEFYNGLRFLGKDAVMVKYPREPHIFTEREHQIDSLQRMLAWYDQHLHPRTATSHREKGN